MDKEIKRQKMKRFFIMFIPLFLLTLSIATQSVAKDCKYDELLGLGIPINDMKIYLPWMFFIWKYKFSMVIPTIILDAQRYVILGTAFSFIASMFVVKKSNTLSSYGSAKWATKKDLRETGLLNSSGVIVGINPYKFKGYKDKKLVTKLLRDDGPAHIGVFAPTRSGKGASIIIPTCLTWNKSLVVLDLKGENLNFTGWFRKKALKNKIIKFEPFSNDGLSAKWNPIAEIRMGTDKEMSDVMSLARMIADPTGKGGEKGDSHWIDTSTALIQTVILHLLYAHKRQDLPIPTLADVSDFLSSRDMPFDDAIEQMQTYDHISTKEFFTNNPFLKVYGNYISSSFKIFNEKLENEGININIDKLLKIKQTLKEESPDLIKKYATQFRSIREIQSYYFDDYNKGILNFEDEESPFRCLLTHPKVAAGAAECANRDPKEQGSVTSSANAKFNLYRDPNIIRNTSISEFTSTDIMNPNQAVTVYLVIPPNKVQDAIPLIRIFINYALDRNMEEMDFDKNKNKQRCLFLLDEFPQLGRIEKMETAMAIMAGYGLKTLFIAQDINQVNKNYSKDNSIISNCHIRIFFAPNEIETAENICKSLGKQTIEVANKSQSGTFTTNKSWNQTGRELLTADEIMKMSKDEAIVLVSGFAPIKAKKAWYFKCPYFMNRTQNNKYPNALDEKPLKSDTVTIINNYSKLDELNGIKNEEYSMNIEPLNLENKTNMLETMDEINNMDFDTPKDSLNEINFTQEQQSIINKQNNMNEEPSENTSTNNMSSTNDVPYDFITDMNEEPSENTSTDNMSSTNDVPYDFITDMNEEPSENTSTDNMGSTNDVPYDFITDMNEEPSENTSTDNMSSTNDVPYDFITDMNEEPSENTSTDDMSSTNDVPYDFNTDMNKESVVNNLTDKINVNSSNNDDMSNFIRTYSLGMDNSTFEVEEKSANNNETLLNLLSIRYSLNIKDTVKLLEQIDTLVIKQKNIDFNNADTTTKPENIVNENKLKIEEIIDEYLDTVINLNNKLKKVA